MNRTTAEFEIGFGILLILGAIVVGTETFKITNLSFDPLGGRAVPFWASVVIALFSLNMVVRGYQALREDIASVDKSPRTSKNAARRTTGMAALLVAYVIALHAEVGFTVATLFFLSFSISLLSNWQKNWIGYGIVIALVTAFGLHYLLTEVIVIDLP